MSSTQRNFDFAYRIEFQFRDEHGVLQKTKTWQLKHRHGAGGKIYLLQARAVLVLEKPNHESLGTNYDRVTIFAAGLIGELACSSFDATDETIVTQQLAAYPIAFIVVLDDKLIRMRLYAK